MLDAIARIETFIREHDASSFASDRKALDAVAFNLLVIGEAASRMPDDVARRHAEVPWAQMRGIRNVITHQYFEVRSDILWQTATGDLPRLVQPQRALLDGSVPD